MISLMCSLENQINGFPSWQNESCHFGVGEGNRFSLFNLLNEKGNDTAQAAKNISEAHADKICLVIIFGQCNTFLKSFGHTHDIDGSDGLVGTDDNYFFDIIFYGGLSQIICSNYIGFDSLEGVFLANRHMFHGCRVENNIYAAAGHVDSPVISDIPDQKTRVPGMFQFMLEGEVFLFVTAKNGQAFNSA